MAVELSAADRERFWSKVWPEPMSGCWLWGDAPNARGVGVLMLRSRGRHMSAPAHRISYEEHTGAIPDGMVVHQKCGQLLCVNPEHLELQKRGGRSTADANDRFDAKVRINPVNGCHEWTASTTEWGYGQFVLGRGQGPTTAHRFAWERRNGPVPDGRWVLHKCDNPPCCNPEHLFLGTRQDNVDDMVRKGRQQRGERHGLAKLTARQVAEIRAARGRHADVGKAYGVSRECVGSIKRGKTWGWLSD